MRLLRLLRAGELGGLLDGRDGWTIFRDRLVSPDGRAYRERDMRQLWLTLTQARLFREGYDKATAPASGGMDAAASVQGACRGSGTTVPLPPPVLGETKGASRQGAAPSVVPTPLPCQTALTKLALGVRLRASAASAEPHALGFISNETSEPRKAETAQRRGLPSVALTSERRQNDVSFPGGASDGKDPAHAAVASGTGGAGGGGGGAAGADRERVHGAGGAQLGDVSGEAAGPIQPPCGRPCPEFAQGDCPFSTCPERAEGRCESALPLRQRPEVQALPRAALKGDTRPSLTADRVPRLLNATGGDAPAGMMP